MTEGHGENVLVTRIEELEDIVLAIHQRLLELETLNDQHRIRIANLEQVHGT